MNKHPELSNHKWTVVTTGVNALRIHLRWDHSDHIQSCDRIVSWVKLKDHLLTSYKFIIWFTVTQMTLLGSSTCNECL